MFKKTAKEEIPNNVLSDKYVDWDVDENVQLVLDGDEIAFKVAAAAEERLYRVTHPNTFAYGDFKNKTEFAKFMDGFDVPEGFFETEIYQKPEHIAQVITTVKNVIKRYCKEFKCDPANVEIYVGGSDNFRLDLPLPIKYKSGRKDSVIPVLLSDIKQYLIDYQGANIVNGKEADDMLTTRVNQGYKNRQSGIKVIGITVDKDAMQTEGYWYNPNTEDFKEFLVKGLGDLYIDDTKSNDPVKGKGRKFLYHQLLIGDKVDTYNPRDLVELVTGKKPRFGEKTSYKILQPLTKDKDCLQAVVDQYAKWFGKESFTYTCWNNQEHTMNYIDALQMYADCAYMQLREGDRINIRKILDKLKVDYD